jgi:DNA polymerase-3 subunit epsilon
MPERLVVLDVETTGLSANTGHRVIEIGCVEIIGNRITDSCYHQYINPKRDIPWEVVRIHGITNEKVKDKPDFATIAKEFRAFVGDDTVVAHNAPFDVGFLNHHLKELGMQLLDAAKVIDTVPIAKRKFPGSPANLDALCRRYNIDLRSRKVHGALVDSRLLARVYIEMVYGSQSSLFVANVETATADKGPEDNITIERQPIVRRPTEEELARHKAFVEQELGDKALWKYDAQYAEE